jgi:maltose/moltooligosaccharide transporter
VLMAIAGIGWASVVSIPFAIFADKVNPERMGFYMGIFNLSVVIPQIIVSGVFGSFIEAAIDKNVIFIICGITLALSAVIWTFVREK